MTDRYANMSDDLLSPASLAAPVTPSDTVPLANASKRLWVGGAGNISLITVEGASVTYTGVPAGTYLHVRAKQVNLTSTTASNIIAEY